MLKTENYQLNKPEVTDPLRVADFNENADIIDAALAQANAGHIRVGSYEGTGVTGRTLELGFTARFILLMSEMNNKAFITIATPDFGLYLNSSDLLLTTSRVVEGGVYIALNANNSDNGANHYFAVL